MSGMQELLNIMLDLQVKDDSALRCYCFKDAEETQLQKKVLSVGD
jgi:hypothetical protein